MLQQLKWRILKLENLQKSNAYGAVDKSTPQASGRGAIACTEYRRLYGTAGCERI